MLDHTPIEIDYREPSEIAAQLAGILGEENVAYGANLKYGDVVWATEECSYGIELKSGSDFLHSLWSKEKGERLETQLSGLRQAVDVPILGKHGLIMPLNGRLMVCKEPTINGSHDLVTSRIVARTGFNPDSVDGFLWAIQFPDEGKDIKVIERPTKEWLINTIAEIFLHTLKPPSERRTFKHTLEKGLTGNVGVDMIAAIPGVGVEKAKALIKKFGSVQNIANAEGMDMVGVYGIGKKLALRIKEALCSTQQK